MGYRGTLGLWVGLILAGLASAAPSQWDAILKDKDGWRVPSDYPISGYSENTPAYFQGVRAYETHLDAPSTLLKSDSFADFVGQSDAASFYRLSPYEEVKHLRPGLQHLANHFLVDVIQLIQGNEPGGGKLAGIPAAVMKGNPYWSAEFVTKKPHPVVSLTPMSLSRVQESLGRWHPWTVYGGSDVDWEKVFWQQTLPKNAVGWLCHLLNEAYDTNAGKACDLKKLGVRFLVSEPGLLPTELRPLIVEDNVSAIETENIKFLFTFRPAAGDSATKKAWPTVLFQGYAARKFAAVPHPATLVFSEAPLFAKMALENPEAGQLPLGIEFSQYAASLNALSFYGLKALDISRRKSRFTPPGRNQTPFTAIGQCDFTQPDQYREIFEAVPSLMGLYSKPTAHLIQMWGFTGPLAGQWVLNGPSASVADIEEAAKKVRNDSGLSRLHYRNYYPVMQVNGFDVRWYRPLVAWSKPGHKGITLDSSLQGSVRFTKGTKKMWMRAYLSDRDGEKALASLEDAEGEEPETTSLNVKKLQEFNRLLGEALTEDLASALLNPVSDEAPYSKWKSQLPAPVQALVTGVVAEGTRSRPVAALTFKSTVTSEYEHEYWTHIRTLSEGAFVNKNNCDCAATSSDPEGLDEHCDKNHLPSVASYLKNYYRKLGLAVHSQIFKWKIDFTIPWWDGLKEPQENLIVVIHGKDGKPHDEAVVLADHYDTAYMGDVYEGENYSQKTKTPETTGHRHASKGADDNYSGTATLMQAALALRDLPLKRDVWLVHITGEEFPADGLGTRNFAQALVEGQKLIAGQKNPKIVGVYQLDMIGHSTERDALKPGQRPKPAIFQISPGRGERAAGLAKIAHEVTFDWNRRRVQEKWDEKFNRTSAWKRTGAAIPQLGKFIPFRGEIRPGWHFRSSLYNTDAQQHSDTGIPVVLFMENYDINRQGYHDTLDNLENIDLDFARGLSAIAIESVAQAATR